MAKQRRQRGEASTKLDEFPEDFEDVLFHNMTVESNRNIPILRSIVYKKVKTAINDRVKMSVESKEPIPLVDTFDVLIDCKDNSDFEVAIIREELMECGFVAEFATTEGGSRILTVTVERKISLTGKLETSRYSDSDSDSDSNEEYPTFNSTYLENIK
jgi:hypothetical protein